MCHKLAGLGVISLTVIWCVALLPRRLPPFWPVLLSVMILAGLPATDGIAALLLEGACRGGLILTAPVR
jgi:hypothetical protein